MRYEASVQNGAGSGVKTEGMGRNDTLIASLIGSTGNDTNMTGEDWFSFHPVFTFEKKEIKKNCHHHDCDLRGRRVGEVRGVATQSLSSGCTLKERWRHFSREAREASTTSTFR